MNMNDGAMTPRRKRNQAYFVMGLIKSLQNKEPIVIVRHKEGIKVDFSEWYDMDKEELYQELNKFVSEMLDDNELRDIFVAATLETLFGDDVK